tara:strand:- start:467 stop:1234 length:768 start_codon:yes stop_codon:yes gene_type:complete
VKTLKLYSSKAQKTKTIKKVIEMKKTQFINAIWIFLFTVAASSASAQFSSFKDKIPGGESKSTKASTGGESWKQVASNFQSARANIARDLQVQVLLSADIADALGLQSEAAVMRAEAGKIEEKGDALGSSDLDAIGEKSASTNELVKEKLSSAESLTAEQTAALGAAATKYVPSLLATIKTANIVKDTISTASGLGAPKLRDGRSAISAAKNIPKVGPAIIKLTVNSVKQGTELFSLMNTKGVATPDTSELAFDM